MSPQLVLYTLLLIEVWYIESSEVRNERARVVGGGARVDSGCSERELYTSGSREEVVLPESVEERE